jgi:hypothetical protein
MPLIKSPSRAAVGTNIREMQAAGHPHAQAVAAALNNARRYGAKFADGGNAPFYAAPTIYGSKTQADIRGALDDIARRFRPPPGKAAFAGGGATTPFVERAGAYRLAHEGFIHSPVPGRTDALPITVKGGSYILPADHVAAIGQGNSLAGADIVNHMFGLGPAGGSPLGKGIGAGLHPIRPTIPHLWHMAVRKDGGASPTKIIAAGGEVAIPPANVVAGVRKMTGNPHVTLDQAHKILDAWVINTRKKHIKTLKGLKPPKR